MSRSLPQQFAFRKHSILRLSVIDLNKTKLAPVFPLVLPASLSQSFPFIENSFSFSSLHLRSSVTLVSMTPLAFYKPSETVEAARRMLLHENRSTMTRTSRAVTSPPLERAAAPHCCRVADGGEQRDLPAVVTCELPGFARACSRSIILSRVARIVSGGHSPRYPRLPTQPT